MSAAVAEKSASGTSRFTVFDFQHKALRLPKSYFMLAPLSQEPVYHVDIGDTRGVIPLAGLRDMFGIQEDTDDAQLLNIVESSLKYVRLIRHGDVVPREILDGTASWPIEDHHRQRAQARIIASVLAAITGQGGAELDATRLNALVDSAEAKQLVRDRAAEMAKLIGIPEERSSEVLDRVEMLAGELGFIEALRDHFQAVFDIRNKLQSAARRIRDRDSIQEVKRVNQLLKAPLEALQRAFDEVDAQTGEAVPALRSLEKIIQLVRRRRDELHFASMDWEEVLKHWRDLDPDTGNPQMPVKVLYRFLAQRNLAAQVWVGPG